MKKTFLTLTLICVTTLAMAQIAQVKRNDYSQLTIAFSTPTPSVTHTKVAGNSFSLLTLDQFQLQSQEGLPALPSLVKLVEVPLGDGLHYQIDGMQCDTVDGATLGINAEIVPAQPSRRKNDFSPVKLVKNHTVYSTDAFCGQPVIQLEAAGIARDRNLARIVFNPIQWNPVTNQLVIVRNLTVTVSQQNADEAATRQLQRHHNPAFNIGVETLNTLPGKDSHLNAPLRYTIVAHSSFRGALDDFAAWKTRQGFLVDLVYTDESNVGSTTSSIKNYLKGLYDNATANSPAPTYVLFVGDIAQIPAFNLSSIGESHSSDLSYCCWTGNDYLPDCYYGRFSAQNLDQLTPQISKTLMYEQYTFPDDSYLSTAALIAGVDGGYSSDYAYTYADPNMDYAAKTYINASNGFSNVYYYKNNTEFAPNGVTVTGSSNDNSASNALINIYNNGCGYVNYSAHGDQTLWYKPSLTATLINSSLHNDNKPMIMIGNCCLTNSFEVSECFGEALLRKGNNGGAAIYIGASNSTYWDDDFYWSVGVRTNITNTCNPSYDANHLGMYDKLFHTHGEAYSNWFTSAGAMMYAGNMSVESSTSSRKEYYWQIYHVMGDPSLMPYIKGAAQYPNASIPNAVVMGATTLSVVTEPYAYVGFTDQEGNLIGAAFANSVGIATLNFSPISSTGTATVVISAQGFKPVVQEINIIANGPYVSATGLSMSGHTAGDSVTLNLTLKNLGIDNAPSVSVELRSNSSHILLDSVGQRDLNTQLAAGSEINVVNIASGIIMHSTPDMTNTPINVIVRWGTTVNDMSTSTFYFPICAPAFQRENYALNIDSDTATTSTLTVTDRNGGHAILSDATISLISLDPAVQIGNSTTHIATLAEEQSVTNIYPVIINGATPQNRSIPVIRTVSTPLAGNIYTDTLNLIFGIDRSLITFEDGTFGDYGWEQVDYPWEITSQDAYEGSYSVRSRTWSTNYWGGNTGDNCNSQLTIEWTSSVDDSISFYFKVSSESNYDFYRFYIDNQQREEASGEYNWTRSAYFVPAGTHTFTFSYEKDGSVSNGSNCAWIDNLHLPISGTLYIYSIDTICQGEEYIFNDDTIGTDQLAPGYNIFYDSNATGIYYLTLMVNDTPEVTVSGDTLIRKGEGSRLIATGAQRYEWYIGETLVATTDILDVWPEETTTYTVNGYNGGCSSTTEITVKVEGTIGIDNPQPAAPEVSIYPNPATDMVNITSSMPIHHIAVYNLQGKLVCTLPAPTADTAAMQLSTAQFSKGIYIVHTFSHDGSSSVSKLVRK